MSLTECVLGSIRFCYHNGIVEENENETKTTCIFFLTKDIHIVNKIAISYEKKDVSGEFKMNDAKLGQSI